ncbi:MAG: hypothetical protein EBV06_03160 [Planctomycetia bacterium]|jgi:hypothetical protein|nr:hypothetical protein [Planctomycetia bacterium]
MGIRRIRRMQRQFDMAKSRRENGMVKTKERVRRDLRLTAMVKAGKLPYIPSIMSWLSVKLDKPASKIVQTDIDKMFATAK